MHFVFGSTLYGKVEAVPGVCHVASRFLHVFFVPLFPTSSWLVIDKRVRPVEIAEAIKLPAIHWGSVGLGWLRFFLIAVLSALFVIVATKISLDQPWIETAPFIFAVIVCAAGLFGSYRALPARPENVQAWRALGFIPHAVLEKASERLARS